MNPTIVGAIIAAVTAVLCQLLVNWGASKKKAVDDAKKEQRLDDRLAAIEHKLDIHNGYAEKLGDISTAIAVIENDIKTLYKARD